MKNYLILALCIVLVSAAMYVYANKKSATVKLSSQSFTNGAAIPQQYTCQGKNISPQLQWEANPSDAIKGYVLIMDDPDAQRVVGKTYVHWIALMTGNTTTLPEANSSKENPSKLAIELLNDAGIEAYSGPCPPAGTGMHTYRFTLFAMNKTPDQLQSNPTFPQAPFTAEQFKETLNDGILGEARITGTYRHKE